MRATFLVRPLIASALAVSLCVATPTFAQSILKDKTGPVPDPVTLETTGLFQDKFVSVGDDMFIGGQPTEKALRELQAKGVRTVINLRMIVPPRLSCISDMHRTPASGNRDCS